LLSCTTVKAKSGKEIECSRCDAASLVIPAVITLNALKNNEIIWAICVVLSPEKLVLERSIRCVASTNLRHQKWVSWKVRSKELCAK